MDAAAAILEVKILIANEPGGSRGQGWAQRGLSAPPGQTRKGTGNGRKQPDPTTPPGHSGSHVPPKKG